MTPPLVLLPGLDGTGDLFARFAREFGDAAATRVVRYPTDRFLDYPELARFVERALPDEPFVLVAESFSGPVAILVAAKRPPRLRALVLCASFARSPAPAAARWLARFATGGVYRTIPRRALTRWVMAGQGPRELEVDISDALARVDPDVLMARFRAVLAVDAASRLASIHVPILCLRARRDRVVRESALAPFRGLRCGVSFRTLDAPHFLLQCAARPAAEEIRAFLASV